MSMKKISRSLMAGFMMLGLSFAPLAACYADGDTVNTETGETVNVQEEKKPEQQGGFFQIVFGSGTLGMLLWFALFADGAAAIYFAIDCFVLINPQKLMPASLIENVNNAMAEGDVVKAQAACDSEPGALSNILSAGFQHFGDGNDVMQEAVNGAADLETERLMQRLTWISVCSNLGPSLGLLGTVQGMIMTFDKLSGSGVVVSELALSIGQALWTTAGGLVVSIPSITMYYALRNKANRLIMRMTALTMELLKSLRNAEVEEPPSSVA